MKSVEYPFKEVCFYCKYWKSISKNHTVGTCNNPKSENFGKDIKDSDTCDSFVGVFF